MDKRVSRNMLLNIIKTFLSVIFPLITYPYATRILGVTNFGKVSYATSIVSYFSLIAGMGTANYAIREGGFLRFNRIKMQEFIKEIFLINLITTFFAYIILVVFLLFTPNLHEYALLILLQSISIIFVTIGVDWINIIFEDYIYISIRSMCIQIVSIFLLLMLVNDRNDYYLYASINVISNATIAVVNLRHICRKAKYEMNWLGLEMNNKICWSSIRKHIKPIMILFSNNLAVSVYCNIDITMVGWICGDYYVGLYSIVAKVYSILKQIIAAAYTVTVTRLSELYGNNDRLRYKKLLNDTITNIFVLAIPVGVIVFEWADTILLLIGGENFLVAKTSLRILSVAIIFAVFGGTWAYCINMPMKKERINLLSTTIGAIENLLLNFIFIPTLGINGAAYTTLLAECTVVFVLLCLTRKKIELLQLKLLVYNISKTLCGCIPIIVLAELYRKNRLEYCINGVLAIIGASIFLYIIIGCLLNNDGVYNLLSILKRKNEEID